MNQAKMAGRCHELREQKPKKLWCSVWIDRRCVYPSCLLMLDILLTLYLNLKARVKRIMAPLSSYGCKFGAEVRR